MHLPIPRDKSPRTESATSRENFRLTDRLCNTNGIERREESARARARGAAAAAPMQPRRDFRANWAARIAAAAAAAGNCQRNRGKTAQARACHSLEPLMYTRVYSYVCMYNCWSKSLQSDQPIARELTILCGEIRRYMCRRGGAIEELNEYKRARVLERDESICMSLRAVYLAHPSRRVSSCFCIVLAVKLPVFSYGCSFGFVWRQLGKIEYFFYSSNIYSVWRNL